MGKIFNRQRLRPSQLRTVAQRRFDDAECLRQTDDNARANGVYYLGGFVVECLLKAKMLERYPSMQRAVSTEGMSESDRQIWRLIYRSHELKEMLPHLPDLTGSLLAADQKFGTDLHRRLRGICYAWTIFARYSPRTEKMKDAEVFLDQIRELKEWLK